MNQPRTNVKPSRKSKTGTRKTEIPHVDWDKVFQQKKAAKAAKTTKPAMDKEAAPKSRPVVKASPSKEASPAKPKRSSRPAKPVAESQQDVRLNRLIANSSSTSRREADTLIAAGQVKLNGKVVTELGTIVHQPRSARIEVKGKLLKTQQPLKTIVFHKPKDAITTRRDEKNRRTIYDVLPAEYRELKPVGRLDRNSTGLLILTNDGELIQLLTHPRHCLSKVYRVELDRPVDNPERLANRLLEGIWLEGETQIARAVEVMMVDPTNWGIVLNTGMNRQVRRMMQACSYDVKSLKRIAVGPFEMTGLRPGEHRELRFNEVQALKRAALEAKRSAEKAARREEQQSRQQAKRGTSLEAQADAFLESLDPSLLAPLV